MPRQAKRLHEPTNNDGSRRVPAKISSEHANIARLAYLHWLDRGCPIGSPEEDWSWAEQDLKSEQTRTV
jgi:hypothetical protein